MAENEAQAEAPAAAPAPAESRPLFTLPALLVLPELTVLTAKLTAAFSFLGQSW